MIRAAHAHRFTVRPRWAGGAALLLALAGCAPERATPNAGVTPAELCREACRRDNAICEDRSGVIDDRSGRVGARAVGNSEACGSNLTSCVARCPPG